MQGADSIAPSHSHLGGHTVQLSTLTPVKGVGLETLGSSGVEVGAGHREAKCTHSSRALQIET